MAGTDHLTSWRRACAAASAAAVLVTFATWAPVTGAHAHPTSAAPLTIDVRSTFTDPGLLTGARDVRCGYAQPGVCELTFVGHSDIAGGLTGFTDYTLWVTSNPDGSQDWHSYETFTGTVAGCGRGTFDFEVEGGTIESGPAPEDPLGRRVHGPWTLVPGSGTGDLRSVADGSGDEEAITYPDSSTRGDFLGSLRCR